MKHLLRSFDKQFSILHKNSCQIIKNTPREKLFWKPVETYSIFSCGEFILRSAGKVEQTFGGIMTRLWDDPFEWTLPEELSTNEKVLEYLNEVEKTRIRGFAFFKNDQDLSKEISAPEKIKTLFELLLESIIEAEQFQGRAFTIYQLILSEKQS